MFFVECFVGILLIGIAEAMVTSLVFIAGNLDGIWAVGLPVLLLTVLAAFAFALEVVGHQLATSGTQNRVIQLVGRVVVIGGLLGALAILISAF